MRTSWLGSFAALALAFVATNAAAQIRLGADDKDGIIAFQAKPPNLKKGEAYDLDINVYDPITHRMKSGLTEGHVSPPDLGKDQTEETFYLIKLNPGIYAISLLGNQHIWGVCFNKSTVYFEVKSGMVTYIGEIDPRPTIEILRRASQAGLLKPKGKPLHFQHLFDQYEVPLTPPDQTPHWHEDYVAFVATKAVGVTAPVEAATLHPAHFNTGHDPFGFERYCVGYLAKPDLTPDPSDAEPQPKP